jgi:hypothetical protein
MVNLRKAILSLKIPLIQRAIKGSHSDSWLSILKHNYRQDIDKLLNTGDDYIKTFFFFKSTSKTFCNDVLETWKVVTTDLEKV